MQVQGTIGIIPTFEDDNNDDQQTVSSYLVINVQTSAEDPHKAFFRLNPRATMWKIFLAYESTKESTQGAYKYLFNGKDIDVTRTPRRILTSWVDNPRPYNCPQMNWGRTLKKALQSYDLPTEFVELREIAADRNEWRAVCGSKVPSATKETPTSSETSGLRFDKAIYPHEYKNLHENTR
jgi:hypothetical protein